MAFGNVVTFHAKSYVRIWNEGVKIRQ